jgi:hypothetical protein
MPVPEVIDPRDAAARLLAEHDDAWVAQLTAELDRHLSTNRLERLMGTWQLSRAQLGTLFGVSRQAASKWIADGVPIDRATHLADVEAITELLERYVKRDRIAAVVRRRADGLGGASLMELIAAGRSSDALRLTREMFTFTDVHT